MPQASITFEVQYFSPDGKVGQWKKEEFAYPLVDITVDGADDMSESASQMGYPMSLLETNSLRATE